MPTPPTDKKYAKYIFQTLNLSESDRKHINIQKDAIYFSFPLKFKLELWVNDKKLILDKEARNGISESIIDFFSYELSKGGFKDILVYSSDPSEREALEFYRDVSSDEDAIEAIQWLLELKKRFGF